MTGTAWCRDALLRSPAHESVAPWIEQLGPRMPTVEELDELRRNGVRRAAAEPAARVRFVPALEGAGGAAAYERRIFASGEVPTRGGSWHDLFNALVWLSFPHTKSAINALHVAELDRAGGAPRDGAAAGRRGPLRDQATLFDEGGMIIACADAALAALLRDFDWRGLFVQRRDRVLQLMRFYVFGHALLEKALRPYKAMAARALTVPVDETFIGRPLRDQLRRLDQSAAERVKNGTLFASRDAVTPVPIAGIPGWDAANEAPAFYDDLSVFRPKGP